MDQANIGYNLRNTEVYQRLCGERLIDQEIHTKEPLIKRYLHYESRKSTTFRKDVSVSVSLSIALS